MRSLSIAPEAGAAQGHESNLANLILGGGHMPLRIPLSGRDAFGKDTAADMLVKDRRSVRLAPADSLKETAGDRLAMRERVGSQRATGRPFAELGQGRHSPPSLDNSACGFAWRLMPESQTPPAFEIL